MVIQITGWAGAENYYIGLKNNRSLYTTDTSGHTCNRVTSKAECEEAAIKLGVSDTVADEEATSGYPPYCYFQPGLNLFFNKVCNG